MITLALAATLVVAEPVRAARLSLPDPRVAFEPAYAREARRTAGASPTAVERPLANGGATGALGYLCGVKQFAPGSNQGGPGSSYAQSTTFLGAKLSLPFR